MSAIRSPFSSTTRPATRNKIELNAAIIVDRRLVLILLTQSKVDPAVPLIDVRVPGRRIFDPRVRTDPSSPMRSPWSTGDVSSTRPATPLSPHSKVVAGYRDFDRDGMELQPGVDVHIAVHVVAKSADDVPSILAGHVATSPAGRMTPRPTVATPRRDPSPALQIQLYPKTRGPLGRDGKWCNGRQFTEQNCITIRQRRGPAWAADSNSSLQALISRTVRAS